MASFVGEYKRFVDTPPDDYVCLICQSVARDPQQIICCAKLYCRVCLDQQKLTSNSCPTCQQNITSFEDKLSSRRINDLKVCCDNEDSGCKWVGELGNLDEHSIACEFAVIYCANGCSQKLLRRELDNHIKTECQLRKHKCPHCSEEGRFLEITATHLDKCPDVVVTCPNTECHTQMKRFAVTEHRKSCPKEVIECSYAKVGCQEKMKRENLSTHETECVQQHLQLAVKRIETLQVLEKRIATLERPVAVVKTPKFSRYKDKKETWYSKTFYSHKGGYKMTLNVDADGHGGGKGTHISVYIFLTGGENDDNLVWPFRGTVTIQLFNQLHDSNHKTTDLDYTDDDAESGKRPPKGGRNAACIGHGRFTSHSELDYNPSTNCQYLKDNCLYFRISVAIDPENTPWLTLTV